jgi:hypothetical protein
MTRASVGMTRASVRTPRDAVRRPRASIQRRTAALRVPRAAVPTPTASLRMPTASVRVSRAPRQAPTASVALRRASRRVRRDARRMATDAIAIHKGCSTNIEGSCAGFAREGSIQREIGELHEYYAARQTVTSMAPSRQASDVRHTPPIHSLPASEGAPVAQSDRAASFERDAREFESLRARHSTEPHAVASQP